MICHIIATLEGISPYLALPIQGQLATLIKGLTKTDSDLHTTASYK